MTPEFYQVLDHRPDARAPYMFRAPVPGISGVKRG